jgi:hypothetical protein
MVLRIARFRISTCLWAKSFVATTSAINNTGKLGAEIICSEGAHDAIFFIWNRQVSPGDGNICGGGYGGRNHRSGQVDWVAPIPSTGVT